ncbi:MAG: N-acetylglucosamine-6-phosphate deacetylase [Clostridia bacterium]|nr:N-acetylglucosamine-6-phosphate deacetylase [Clostridia bacterium]
MFEEVQAVINANIVLRDDIVYGGTLIIKGNHIECVSLPGDTVIPENAKIVDAGGLYVGPGFVDIHSHGAKGKLIYDEPEETTTHFLKSGHTTILSAFYDDLDSVGMIKAAENIKIVRKNGVSSKIIEGIYMEGPYMNFKYGAEAQNKKWNPHEINFDDYSRLVETLGDFAKVWVVAPERDGIEDFVKYVKKINPDAVISVGHSEATPDQIRDLKKYGLILQTHCMDATGRVGEGGGIRRCGPDEECLLDDNMYAEVICDSLGIHVDPDMLKLIYKVKTKDRIVLITDSTASDGTASEMYPDATDLNFDNQGMISGSKLTLDAACRNMMKHTSCGITDAFVMASYNPACVLGLDNEIGSIAPGKRANLVFTDSLFNVKRVMLNGKFTEELLCHN